MAAYSAAQGLDTAHEMAVVVQVLVPAEASGVLFTANPLSGARDQMLINATWGLGEALLSARITWPISAYTDTLLTLPEALQALTDQVESRRFKGILGDIANKVNEGSSLADSVARYPEVFMPLYINMVRAGEASGALETVLLRIADFMDQQEELKGKVTSAMIYPIIMTVLSGGIVMMLMINVVPQITDMFDGMNAELPWNTK